MKKGIILLMALFVCVASLDAAMAIKDDGVKLGEAIYLDFEGVGTSFDGNTATIDCADLGVVAATSVTATTFTGDLVGDVTADAIIGESLTSSDNVMTLLGVDVTESGGVIFFGGVSTV
jgi:hypothetical protein